MARYIDADEALRVMRNVKSDKPSYGDWELACDCCIGMVEVVPTADVVEIDDSLEIVIMSAVRYALGRRTYVPSAVIGFITPLLDKLSYKTLAVLERDICDANSYGDEKIDKPDWMMLLQKIREEKERRTE